MYRNEPSELADVSKRIEELEKTHGKKSLRNMPEYRKARALQRKLLPGSFKHVKEILKHKVEKKKAHAHPASKREHESDRDYVHGEEVKKMYGPCEDFEPEYGDWYDDYGSDGFDGEDYDEMVVVTSAHENTTGGATHHIILQQQHCTIVTPQTTCTSSTYNINSIQLQSIFLPSFFVVYLWK